jgi:hypothetical protein
MKIPDPETIDSDNMFVDPLANLKLKFIIKSINSLGTENIVLVQI